MARKLVTLRRPIEPIELPTGHVVHPVPISAEGLDLADEIGRLAKAGKGLEALEKTKELLQLCVPDITERDIKFLGIEDQRNLIAISSGNIELLEAELGNAPGAGAAPSSAAPASTEKTNGMPDSNPSTNGSTSVPASRKRSGRGTPTSGAAPTRKR